MKLRNYTAWTIVRSQRAAAYEGTGQNVLPYLSQGPHGSPGIQKPQHVEVLFVAVDSVAAQRAVPLASAPRTSKTKSLSFIPISPLLESGIRTCSLLFVLLYKPLGINQLERSFFHGFFQGHERNPGTFPHREIGVAFFSTLELDFLHYHTLQTGELLPEGRASSRSRHA